MVQRHACDAKIEEREVTYIFNKNLADFVIYI